MRLLASSGHLKGRPVTTEFEALDVLVEFPPDVGSEVAVTGAVVMSAPDDGPL